MKVRKFYVQDMREGMLRVKDELGPDAIILESRRVRMKGLKGFFTPSRIELTAAVDNTPSRTHIPEAPPYREIDRGIREELSELKKIITRLVTREEKPVETNSRENELLQRWRMHLEQQEVVPDLIHELLEELKKFINEELRLPEEVAVLFLRKSLRKRFKTMPEKGAMVQVFVGPTGVGKTTTLAKLAARYALYQGEKVGIITIDHYRIGALEQLRTYSDITGLPLEVVMTPKDLRRAIEKFNWCQRILIDTAGRSTLNTPHIQELAGYLQNLPPAEIFLVNSATTKMRDLKIITENFRCMNYNRLIFTKLDETSSYGLLLNSIYYTGLPLIYLTMGQSVPDDICLADVDKMAALILGEED